MPEENTIKKEDPKVDIDTSGPEVDVVIPEEKKEEIAQILIRRLNKVQPGIADEIDYYELATPKTIERYTMNPGGTVYGYAQTVEQSGRNRIRAKSPVDGLYFASAWAFPGGGFTGAIISGYLCAVKVKKYKYEKG